jgi:outer membrane receptor protein involved in Fe transport
MHVSPTRSVRYGRAFLALGVAFATVAPAGAQTPPAPPPPGPPTTAPAPSAPSASATITGLVIDLSNALPIVGARVELRKAGVTVLATTTDGSGRYTFAAVPGIYSIVALNDGYGPTETSDVSVVAGTTIVNASLRTSETRSQGTLTTIGSVSSSARALSAATTISRDVSLSDITSIGDIRIADLLGTLPGVNFSTSSSVGDDTSISLRGFGPDETASLLDGHPVGPLGVGSGGFNFSLGPAFGLSSVDVTYGSGAQGFYGSDTIGGAVNFVTIDPTQKPHFSFQQQIGGFGIRSTGVTATGTYDKLGYALAVGRLGEYGDFYPGSIAQSARPNNVAANSANPNGACSGLNTPYDDVSACNLAVNTYNVSQNTEQTIGLLKLDYAISPVTHFKAAAYGAIQWSDSTGNGDNDFVPYGVRLGQITSAPTNCTVPGGAAGYVVTTDPLTGTNGCYSAAQYAASTYGPDGGGDGRQRSTTMRDYNFTFTTKSGINDVTVEAYDNNYQFWKDSSLAGGTDANGVQLGTPTFAEFYNTEGFLFSDEVTTGRNYAGVGYTVYHQLQDGNEDDVSGVSPKIPTGYFGEGSFFLRDTYQLNDRVSLFANAWVKHSSVTDQTTFDPRATIQFRPTNKDVVQVTYGRSDGAPSPQLKLAGAAEASDPGASLTSVNCNGYNDVTSAGNPALQAEGANDWEFGYGHRFKGDSNVQFNAYVTAVGNQLFGASEPILQYGLANVNFAPGALATYLNRLQTQCPGEGITMANIYQYLSVSTTYNASHALARGIELSGRQRFAKIAYVDYGYFIESSTQSGIVDQILASNPNVINGAQIAAIPLHQANVSLDVAPGPWEFRLNNYYMGPNNTYNRPAFWHSDAFLSRSFNNGNTLITLGGTNIFNQAVQTYGYLGLGNLYAQNAAAVAAGNTNGPTEEFGIAPAQLTLTMQLKI